MSSQPEWEAPVAGRRLPLWVWAVVGLAAVALTAQLGRAPTPDPLPGLPVEVADPVQPPEPGPVRRGVPDPSDRWEALPPAPRLLGELGPAVWTGEALVAWSGIIEVLWDAEEDAWRVPTGGATVRRDGGWSATWTGSEILYFGGTVDGELPAHVWGYEPGAQRWRLGADAPVAGRTGHAAVWDGQRLHVWGGRSSEGALLADGASYDPAANTWTALPPSPLGPRADPEAAWLAETGELLVWGGTTDEEPHLDGAAYRPADGSWRLIPAAPWAFRLRPAAASDGQRRLFLWGLPAAGLHLPDGLVYDVVEDAWRPLPDLLDQERAAASATFVPGEDLLVVWGGLDRRLERARLDGFALELGSGRWRQIPAAPLPDLRAPATAWVSTPSRQGLLVWGERAGSGAAFYPDPVLRGPLAAGPASR